MSDPMEPPPWAFEACGAWTACQRKIEASGTTVEQIACWRLDDGDATRGENFRRFDLVDATTRLFSVIVEARAEAGFTLWIEAAEARANDQVETLLRAVRKCLSE